MSDVVIQTTRLRKTFRNLTAVDSLDLAVPRGSVYGFIGRNGAGKTTTIKMMLGLLTPTDGAATVLGLDSQRQSLDIRGRVGYVPERHDMYRWMTISELMWFIKPFYPTWDDAECQRLLKHFELDPSKRIKELSKGMVAKVGLTLALAHRPEILIIDEPTGGLDAIVRREFLESIIHLVDEGGRTVLISSHLLTDVERVADQVAVIEGGKLIAQEPLKSLKDRVRQMRLRFTTAVPERIELDGLLSAKRHNHEWVITVSNFQAQLPQALKQRLGADAVELVDLSLEDVFVELVGYRAAGP